MSHLTDSLETFAVESRQAVNGISCDNEWRDRFIERLAFEEAEIAHDAYMEERCIYRGYTEAEVMTMYPDQPDDPEPSYDDMIMKFDGRRIYIHCGCEVCRDVCLCTGCTEDRTRHNLSWWRRILRRFW
jgi:hypothetical protein